MLKIHGKWWQHAKDLQSRWIFDGFDARPDNSVHAVAVPIYVTRFRITELLKSDVAPINIVNLAGVMSTSPNGIHNAHFLFGPNTQDDLSVVTTCTTTSPWKVMLDNAERRWMRIIETTREEHDTKMAIIQWLSHFLLVFIGWTNDEDVHENLITPWIAPEVTIQDMIFQNSPAEIIIKEFFDTLYKNAYNPLKTFQNIVESHLTPDDIDKFSTPNFRRIQRVIAGWTIQITLSEDYVRSFRESLNSQWMLFISKTIQSIR